MPTNNPDLPVVIAFLRSEASAYRHAQANATTDTDKLYRMGQKDALLLAAEAIERGALSHQEVE